MTSRVTCFNFHGTIVSIESNSAALLDRLRRDFSFFENRWGATPHYRVSAFLGPVPKDRLPKAVRPFRGKNAISMKARGQPWIRYNDYYGQGLCIYDFKADTAEIFAEDLNRLHEIAYLVALSRSGKRLDRQGLHRIHAMGVSRGGASLLCMMPMGGGKTTLFLHLLKDLRFEMISDDSPLITRGGDVIPYPLRVGLVADSVESYRKLPHLDFSSSYTIDRVRFGRKVLLPVRSLPNPVSRDRSGPLILLHGIRSSDAGCRIRKASFIRIYPSIITNLIIGVGLPMMAEYFIENHWRDWLRLPRILASRIVAGTRLAWKARKYVVYLGRDPETNAEAVSRLMSSLEGTQPTRNPAP